MDRLIDCLDSVAAKNPDLSIKAQIGNSNFSSTHLQSTQWCDANEFEKSVRECDLLVSHAGMGNILLAARYKKPIIIMPRRADLKEHINNHQIGTATALANKSFIHIANNCEELEIMIFRIIQNKETYQHTTTANQDPAKSLIRLIKRFIDDV